jgi:hypothetical protein
VTEHPQQSYYNHEREAPRWAGSSAVRTPALHAGEGFRTSGRFPRSRVQFPPGPSNLSCLPRPNWPSSKPRSSRKLVLKWDSSLERRFTVGRELPSLREAVSSLHSARLTTRLGSGVATAPCPDHADASHSCKLCFCNIDHRTSSSASRLRDSSKFSGGYAGSATSVV